MKIEFILTRQIFWSQNV